MISNESDGEALDQRLVQVALDLLDRQGIESLTLRRVARRAGVSHSAPLRHFESLSDLRSETAARGFQLLSEAVDKSSALLPPDAGPLARLAQAGRAYVEAAVAHPGLFALMFRPELLDPGNTSYERQSRAAFEVLLRHVREAQRAGFEPERDARTLAGAIWAAVHGLATLWAQGGMAAPIPGASLDQLFTTTLELILGIQPGDPT